MASGIVALDHVQVAAPAGCEEAARDFYGGLLGLEELAKPTGLAARGGVWFACGSQELHVGVADQFVPATKAHPALRVEGEGALDRLAERLRATGLPVDRDSGLTGHRRFYTRDPFGNRIELLART
jgi:catechol 2,3-dioxygenase-like lactoylglutathione lyase family enzyme